jgi:hypothetical protein
MTKASPMTILGRTKCYLWRKRRDQSECHDNPRVGEGWLVAENKGLDRKGASPVTNLRLARGDLWWKIKD